MTPDLIQRLERSPIGRLALSLYPNDPCGKYFSVFTGYYDESGTHDGSPITVLGGFVGKTLEWADFDREWRKILAKHDLRFIRAKQLFHREDPYRNWSEKQLDHLWADILYVLQEHKHFQISKIILRDDDYRRSYIADAPISPKERLDTRYALCARVALHFYPLMYNKLQGQGEINFVLEAGHKNSGDALRVFSALKNSQTAYPWAKFLGAMSFGTKPDFPALQAADLIAYWFYRTELENLTGQPSSFPISEIERELAQCGLQIYKHTISPRDLANLRQNYLAKKKRKVFNKTEMVLKAEDYVVGGWNAGFDDLLLGVEFSDEDIGDLNVAAQNEIRRRMR